MIEIPRNPTRRDLFVFGALLALFVVALALMLDLRWDAPRAARVVGIAGSVVAALFFLVPRLRRPLYVGWMTAVYPIGWVVSHLLLALVYYTVVTLVGLALRLAGRDVLARRLEPEEQTYWQPHVSAPDRKRYFRQY